MSRPVRVRLRPSTIGPLVCCDLCGRDTRSPSGVCRHCRGPETAAQHEQEFRRPTDPQGADAWDATHGPPDAADPYHGDLDDGGGRLDMTPTCDECGEELERDDGGWLCFFCEDDES